MNTPSKEALEAAFDLFKKRYCFGSDNDNATIIDRHFAPLRRRAEKAEARVGELEFGLKHQCETCEMKSIFDGEHAYALKMQARVKELEAELASEKTTRNAIIAKGQQAEARVKEYEAQLSAVMPADFKDWHQNSRSEWPVVTASVIRNLQARMKELEACLVASRADCDRRDEWLDQERSELAALRAANAELKKQEAESRRLFYAEQDKRQSAEFRCEELAVALREAQHLVVAWESADGEPATELLRRIDAVLAHHAAGEPEAQK